MSITDRLNEDDSYAEAWLPKQPGDTLVGRVVDIGVRQGNYEPYTIVTVKQENGTRLAFHAFHFVASEELRKYKLKYGVEIGIKYLGKPDGKNYERYKVISDAEFAVPGDGQQPPPTSDVPSDFGPTPSGTPGAGDEDIPF